LLLVMLLLLLLRRLLVRGEWVHASFKIII
jgi:hypothetical protein